MKDTYFYSLRYYLTNFAYNYIEQILVVAISKNKNIHVNQPDSLNACNICNWTEQIGLPCILLINATQDPEFLKKYIHNRWTLDHLRESYSINFSPPELQSEKTETTNDKKHNKKTSGIKSSQSDYQREDPKAAFNQEKTKETPVKSKGNSHYTFNSLLELFKKLVNISTNVGSNYNIKNIYMVFQKIVDELESTNNIGKQIIISSLLNSLTSVLSNNKNEKFSSEDDIFKEENKNEDKSQVDGKSKRKYNYKNNMEKTKITQDEEEIDLDFFDKDDKSERPMKGDYSHSGDRTSEGLSFAENKTKVNCIEKDEKIHILGTFIDYHSLSALVESRIIDSSIINAFSRLSLLKASATFPSYHCVSTFFSPILRHSVKDATMFFSHGSLCKFYKQLKIKINSHLNFFFFKDNYTSICPQPDSLDNNGHRQRH